MINNELTGMWRLPMLDRSFGFAIAPAGDGGAIAYMGTDRFFLSSLFEVDALHGAKGEGAFAWKGTSITQSAHSRFNLGHGFHAEFDLGYTRFDSYRPRFVSSLTAVLVGARFTHHSTQVLAPTDSMTLSLGFAPTAISGEMRGTAPFRSALRDYSHKFTNRPEIKAGIKYRLNF